MEKRNRFIINRFLSFREVVGVLFLVLSFFKIIKVGKVFRDHALFDGKNSTDRQLKFRIVGSSSA